MPTYEVICTNCKKASDVYCSMSEYEKGIECPTCSSPTTREFRSLPNMVIPAGSSYDGNVRALCGDNPIKRKEVPTVPINIIDEKPDGSCRVTRIGKKTDIDNE